METLKERAFRDFSVLRSWKQRSPGQEGERTLSEHIENRGLDRESGTTWGMSPKTIVQELEQLGYNVVAYRKDKEHGFWRFFLPSEDADIPLGDTLIATVSVRLADWARHPVLIIRRTDQRKKHAFRDRMGSIWLWLSRGACKLWNENLSKREKIRIGGFYFYYNEKKACFVFGDETFFYFTEAEAVSIGRLLTDFQTIVYSDVLAPPGGQD